jgi:2'-5' RNA ligase
MRTFAAAPVRATPELDVLLQSLGELPGGVRPVAPGRLHFTLKFMGETDPRVVKAARSDFPAAYAAETAAEIELVGVGVFPHLRRPTVVWAGVADPEPLRRWAALTDEFFASHGQPRENRPFRPHLTLARIRSRAPEELAGFVTRHAETPLGRVRLDQIAWYESELNPSGARHQELAVARL